MLYCPVVIPIVYNDDGKNKEKIYTDRRVSQNMMPACFHCLKYNCYF